MTLVYIISSHKRLAGVRLSKSGHWGNIPYDSDKLAELAALSDAGGQPCVIERERY